MEPLYELAERLAYARAAVITAYRQQVEQAERLGARLSVVGFVAAYNRGRVAVPTATRAAIPKINLATLRRWLRMSRTGDPSRLAPKWKGRRSDLERRDELRAVIEMGMAADRNVSAAALHRRLRAAMPDARMPSLRTLQRYLERLRSDV